VDLLSSKTDDSRGRDVSNSGDLGDLKGDAVVGKVGEAGEADLDVVGADGEGLLGGSLADEFTVGSAAGNCGNESGLNCRKVSELALESNSGINGAAAEVVSKDLNGGWEIIIVNRGGKNGGDLGKSVFKVEGPLDDLLATAAVSSERGGDALGKLGGEALGVVGTLAGDLGVRNEDCSCDGSAPVALELVKVAEAPS
jgi:hypothetical protein